MSQLLAAAPFTEADYEMISSAVLETARGRWFLAEHARRNRNADTLLVLEAIDKLERSMAQRTTSAETDRIRVDLVEMMDAIARTKAEVAAIKPAGNGGQINEASTELDSIVATTERATSDILAATEHFQEIGHTLREQGVNSAVCDLMDTNAADIFAACTFQDLTGQRIRKVIEVLRFLEERIDAMIGIWPDDENDAAAAVEPRPQMPRIERRAQSEEYHRQETVDEVINGTRAQDVTWRDAPVQKVKLAASHGSQDLDDLLVFEDAPPTQAAPDPAPAEVTPAAASNVQPDASVQTQPAEEPQPAPQAEPEPMEHPGASSGLASLTLTERMALFS
jgi:chemotaxis regulatin CheY-phosphate phosphatase CheZ